MFYKDDFITCGRSLIEVIDEARAEAGRNMSISEDIYKYYNELMTISTNYKYEVPIGFERQLISSILSYPMLTLYAFLLPARFSRFYDKLERSLLCEINANYNGSITRFMVDVFKEISNNTKDMDTFIMTDSIISEIARHNTDTIESLVYNTTSFEVNTERNVCIAIIHETLEEMRYIHKDIIHNAPGILSNYIDIGDRYIMSQQDEIVYDLMYSVDGAIKQSIIDGTEIPDIEETMAYFSEDIEASMEVEGFTDSPGEIVEEAYFRIINTLFDILSGESMVNSILTHLFTSYEEYDIRGALLDVFEGFEENIGLLDILCYVHRSLQKVVLDFS